ncbi:hypothetical protein COCSUDRAFT_83677 [Coccomyxa subellipsoidea C-169]|uniref:Uncharacterized protein n=1 Tax=Coccomyxa subellipsoidea (strain C-169) TaxID=574566 RepID=I0Z154_COCSC|nr:hypothetical protein COCSUDRAFT_83677 [Coccomyxa subellipsoidea C-169]EIE24373.1 hypothetical protein COCSUDRAFT_83677 [Coccomyxa subellipsoidea C-169]|eukprot:XP_005648917.1 hypothetical protein COCSUDRAFT_83677 [Coccomyxa subellipsoidea C-169]
MDVNKSRLVWQVARAGDLADWLVRKSMMHPAMRDVPVRFDMTMGGWPDPTTRGTAGSFEPLTLQLQRAAYRRAITLVQQRRPVIEQVARELCHPVDGIEQVEGHRIVELLETTPLAPVQPDPDAPEDATSSSAVPVSKGSLSGCAQFSGRDGRPGAAVFAAGVGAAGSEWERMAVEDEALRAAAEVVIGRADLQDLTGLSVPTLKADQIVLPVSGDWLLQVRQELESEDIVARLRAVRRYANGPHTESL